jgi:hypothetical protein
MLELCSTIYKPSDGIAVLGYHAEFSEGKLPIANFELVFSLVPKKVGDDLKASSV